MSGTARLPSLGDTNTAGYVRNRFTVPMPEGREVLLKEFARIISMGLVQKVVVEVGQPIVYERLSKSDGAVSDDLERIETGDLYGAIRNAELLDFKRKGSSGFLETVFYAFRFLQMHSDDLVPKAFMCGSWLTLRMMLGLAPDDDISELFGVRVYWHEEVPDDVLLLVASTSTEPDVVSMSLRIPMDTDDSVIAKAKRLIKEKAK
jgi:hypothetical protein